MPLTRDHRSQPITWFGPHLTGRELERLRDVLDRQYVNDGPLAREFERRIAAFVGTRHAVVVTSGTVAIALSLMAAGIGPGDEVLVPDLTFIATANAVRLAGADVKLVDVEPVRFGVDADAVEAAIGPRTRALVTVDVNGRGADYTRLEPLCQKAGLVLICDAAEGLGSRFAGRMLGSFGLAGCFSFSANKTVTAGQGGMIVTDSDALHDRLRELKDQGRHKGGTGGDDEHPVLGFNFKFTDLQAAVALAQFDEIEERLKAAVRRDRAYAERLANQPGLSLPPFDEPDEVRQWTDVLIEDRASITAALDAAQFGSRNFWHPLHSQAPYAAASEAFANSVDISRRGLWLASRLDLTMSDIDRVSSVIVRGLRP
jgi:perosamine synthetase